MSGPKFHETSMGHMFYEHTMPELVRQLKKLNKGLGGMRFCSSGPNEANKPKFEICTPKEVGKTTVIDADLYDKLLPYFEDEENSGELDDLVYDVFGKKGQAVNNAGGAEQLKFLFEECGSEWVKETLWPLVFEE